MWRHKRLPVTKAILRGKKMEVEESDSLTSDYTTKLNQSKQYGTGAKTEICVMEKERKPRNKLTHLWPINI